MTLYNLRTIAMLGSMVLALLAWWSIRPPRQRANDVTALIAALAIPVEIGGYLSTLHEQNNSVSYNLFVCVEFLLVVRMVYDRVQHSWLMWFTVVAGILSLLLNSAFVNPQKDILIEAIVVISLLLALSISTALWRMANSSHIPLHRIPRFWLLAGNLLYFAGLPPVVTMARFVYAQDTSLVNKLWTIVPLLCTFRYMMAAYAFNLERRQRDTAIT